MAAMAELLLVTILTLYVLRSNAVKLVNTVSLLEEEMSVKKENIAVNEPQNEQKSTVEKYSSAILAVSEESVKRELLEPIEGAYVGVVYNNSVSLEKYYDFIGFKPTTVGVFCRFPLTAEDKKSLVLILKQVTHVGGILMLTLEPYIGLEFVRERECRELVDFISPYETMGVSFFLRFGHEMNGGWYPWGQKPTLYKEKFRLLAGFVRSFTCRTVMVWAPNNGGGYPFSGFHVCTKSSCPDFNILDTNKDGELTMEDDMYTPYYPGDNVVDWVGMTINQWDHNSTEGTNEIPDPSSFWDWIRGNYNGKNGNETVIPDFYAMFCNDTVHMKPLVVPEVPSTWSMGVKPTLSTQLFNAGGDKSGVGDATKSLPRLKMVVFSEEHKSEEELDRTVLARTSTSTKILEVVNQDFQVPDNGHHYWKVLSDYHRDEQLVDATLAPKTITIISNQTVTVTVGVPSQIYPAEIGVEIYSVNEDGIPDNLFGSGSTILTKEETYLMNISIIFREPKDPIWQKGTLYYSAFVRHLQKNPHNRSNLCTVRSPIVRVEAVRNSSQAFAPLTPSLLVLYLGEITISVVIFLLLLISFYVIIRRQALAWGQMSENTKGAFRFAAAEGNIAVMEEISKMKGFDINMGFAGFTALHSAVIQDQVASVEWLLSHGADFQCKKQENWNDTALHYAAANGFADVAQILLRFGANPCLKNFQNATPGDLALENGHIELASDFIKASRAYGVSVKESGGDQLDVLSVTPTLPLTAPLLGKEPKFEEDVETYIGRVNYGLGTHGARLKEGTYTWRFFAVVCQIWKPVERDPRSLQLMCLLADGFPSVDVYVVCYDEPIPIIEATVCAVLNMRYPPAKLQVYVLDDGDRKEVKDMCKIMQKEMLLKKSGRYGQGWGDLHYSARTKVSGVSHHAKAGNINSQLLKGRKMGQRQGDFVVVFDCDMIPRPDFLDRVMGHFFKPSKDGWELRKKLAFVQTPQDFYNVGRDDPMGHRATFFYGPMMQGRDGLGACPCVGTGVIFRRDALISIGGQAFGSITEDYNTAMALMGAGFSSIYLNDRLIYGLVPDDLNSVFKQRLRWAMGAIQILHRSNPLFKPELTITQSILFFQSAIQIGFEVTKKNAESDVWCSLRWTWVYLLYYLLIVLGILLNVPRFAFGAYSFNSFMGQVVAIAWGILVCMYIWPPVSMICPWYKPGVGGKVEWDDTPPELADAFHPENGPAAEVEKQIQQEAELIRHQPLCWEWFKENAALRLRKWFGPPQDVSEKKSIRNLSKSASVLSRPEFTLMRRVRDSFMFFFVNSVTLISLFVAGILYILYHTEPVQSFIHSYLVPLTIQHLRDYSLPQASILPNNP